MFFSPLTTGSSAKGNPVLGRGGQSLSRKRNEVNRRISTFGFLPNSLFFSQPSSCCWKLKETKGLFLKLESTWFYRKGLFGNCSFPLKRGFCQFVPFSERTKILPETIFKDIFRAENGNIIITIFTRLVSLFFSTPFKAYFFL